MTGADSTSPRRTLRRSIRPKVRMTPEHVGTTKSVGHLLLFLGEREIGDPHGSRLIPDDEMDRVLGGEVLRLELVLIVLPRFGSRGRPGSGQCHANPAHR